jgi:hypothetical protein
MYPGRVTKFQQARLDAAYAKADREAALRAQNGRCKYCLCRLSYKTATRDHVVARAVGGSDFKENIVAACSRCNRVKAHLPVKTFVRMITQPRSGEPMVFRMVWVDRRVNQALIELEKNVMRRVGRRQ